MILTDYLINGQNLTGEHASLIVGTTHFTSISPRINSVTVNGRSGVMLPAGPLAFDAPEITLKFITNGPDADTLMHRFYRLCRLASSLTRVERDTSTGLTRRPLSSNCLTFSGRVTGRPPHCQQPVVSSSTARLGPAARAGIPTLHCSISSSASQMSHR